MCFSNVIFIDAINIIITATTATTTFTVVIVSQGFAHHASAVLKRFASRDSNMPAAAASHVMLAMRVMACESW